MHTDNLETYMIYNTFNQLAAITQLLACVNQIGGWIFLKRLK